jgi:hypothetical protein
VLTKVDTINATTDSGQDVVFMYDWCVAQAQAKGDFDVTQRGFRFEYGQYTGSSWLPGMKTMLGAAVELWKQLADAEKSANKEASGTHESFGAQGETENERLRAEIAALKQKLGEA